MKIIGRGAEANLYMDGGKLIKERIRKDYRIGEIDKTLRKTRTKREFSLMQRAGRSNIPTPRAYDADLENYKITMELIDGVIMREFFESLPENRLGLVGELSENLGEIVGDMHRADIVHNDLTTSNVMLKRMDEENKGEIYKIFIIDFGLGVFSKRIEDKSIDLLVFKKALRAAHPEIFENIYENFIRGYKKYEMADAVLKNLKAAEKRGRYL